jgi:hypothetical protein
MTIDCTKPDCPATTERPGRDGWSYICDWEDVPDGYYCPLHAAQLEWRHLGPPLVLTGGKDSYR